MISLSVQPSEDGPLSVCPTVGIRRVCLTTVPTANGCRAWFSPRDRSLFLAKFYVGKVFLPTTANFQFSKSGPRRDVFQCTKIHRWDQARTPSSHPGRVWAFGSILCKDAVGLFKGAVSGDAPGTRRDGRDGQQPADRPRRERAVAGRRTPDRRGTVEAAADARSTTTSLGTSWPPSAMSRSTRMNGNPRLPWRRPSRSGTTARPGASRMPGRRRRPACPGTDSMRPRISTGPTGPSRPSPSACDAEWIGRYRIERRLGRGTLRGSLPGLRRRAEAAGGLEGAVRLAGRGPRGLRGLRPRGADPGRPRSRGDRPGLRHRPDGRRPLLHRLEVRRRLQPGPPAAGRAAVAEGRGRLDRDRRGGPAFRPCLRGDPSRREARQHPPRSGGPPVRRRLRPGAAGGRAGGRARVLRHPGLREPRAGAAGGPPDRGPVGRLQPGRGALRGPDRPQSLPPRDPR